MLGNHSRSPPAEIQAFLGPSPRAAKAEEYNRSPPHLALHGKAPGAVLAQLPIDPDPYEHSLTNTALRGPEPPA